MDATFYRQRADMLEPQAALFRASSHSRPPEVELTLPFLPAATAMKVLMRHGETG